MANALNQDITNKVVLLKELFYYGGERERRFLCLGGSGCRADTNGTAVWGVFLVDGEYARVHGSHVACLSDDQTVPAELQASPARAKV